MEYISIGLFLLIIFLAAYLLFVLKSIAAASDQMEEIEKHPERNRQLKGLSTNQTLERHFNKINDIYQARQQERIIYQRSETKIRQEIENISHDLRTPLTSILGYLDLMEDCNSPEERAEYLEIIGKRAKLLQGLIQDFYEISRIEADDYPMVLDVINIQAMLKDAMVAYYHEFTNKNLEVTLDLEDKPTLIIADKIQFNRILNNLIQNALKYAKVQFRLEQYSEQDYCVIRFVNDKNNITEDEIKLIFQRFYTGDQSRSNQSTGLGLTITKALVEKMKGTIEAKVEGDSFILEMCWPRHQGK